MALERIREEFLLPPELQSTYEKLYIGLRNREDPVSWRTKIIDIEKILGVEDPEHEPVPQEKFQEAEALVNNLIMGTAEEALIPETCLCLGLPVESEHLPQIDTLLLNGRHMPEALLWKLHDYLEDSDLNVATFNPVGHFRDRSTRIIGPTEFLRPIDKVVVLASTQEAYGGNVNVLANTMRLIRNPDFARWVNEVDVVIPMFGGSRGDKPGQNEKMYEVLEAIFNPKQLALPMRDVLNQLERDPSIDRIPNVRFITVDIHSDIYPRKTFEEHGFEFESACPQPEFANAAMIELARMDALELPKRIIAMDEGAISRTEYFAFEILTHPLNEGRPVEIVYMDKTRIEAGEVDSAEVARVERWELSEKYDLVRTELPLPTVDEPYLEDCALLGGDDIFDTGHTFETDLGVVLQLHPNASKKVFGATHPVLSEGMGILDELPVDTFLFGNTLHTNGLSKHDKVRMVDVAPAIFRVLYK